MGRAACTEPQCLYKDAPYPSPPSSAVVKKEYSSSSTPPMGLTAFTEPQCLYKGAPYLYLLMETVTNCAVDLPLTTDVITLCGQFKVKV